MTVGEAVIKLKERNVGVVSAVVAIVVGPLLLEDGPVVTGFDNEVAEVGPAAVTVLFGCVGMALTEEVLDVDVDELVVLAVEVLVSEVAFVEVLCGEVFEFDVVVCVVSVTVVFVFVFGEDAEVEVSVVVLDVAGAVVVVDVEVFVELTVEAVAVDVEVSVVLAVDVVVSGSVVGFEFD
ncbi:hypothetical protein NZD48_00695 [Staphylococcus hyicus]|uniref:hypothetical protein n=1 Tax=Staphylococcus hyicus TaxID=1284 RepID=UPI00217CE85F|nr:hypothetical protein [Staphylococcus hyicus]UWF56906.1 hypothetical protein NZD48_00695 [Staphylococcus hyicus]